MKFINVHKSFSIFISIYKYFIIRWEIIQPLLRLYALEGDLPLMHLQILGERNVILSTV